LISVFDSEGGVDDFIIVLRLLARPADFSLIIFVIIGIIASIGLVSLLIYFRRRRKTSGITLTQPDYQDYYYQPTYDREEEYLTPEPVDPLGTSIYCPFCGFFVRTPKKFCPSCGESLLFDQNE
jgi:LPXTG-motif cell wall-anchored protein